MSPPRTHRDRRIHAIAILLGLLALLLRCPSWWAS